MFIESSTLLWADLIVTGVLGTIATPFVIYILGQIRDRKNEAATHAAEQKKELSSAFESIRQQRDTDQRHIDGALGDLREKAAKLQTTVDIKRETVDRVQEQQGTVGIRVAIVETAIKTITDSLARSEQNWLKISEKLEGLGRIEETVKNLAEDMREVRAEQARKSG